MAFDKYSPREFRNLWELSKSEILQDIKNRNGVEKRKKREWSALEESDSDYGERVVPRTVSSGGSKSDWFYLRMKGVAPFSAGVRMDIKRPSEEVIQKHPKTWWKKSKHAKFLNLELQSLIAYYRIPGRYGYETTANAQKGVRDAPNPRSCYHIAADVHRCLETVSFHAV